MTADSSSLRAQVEALPWYHSIDLGDGVVTPGVVNNARTAPRYKLPSLVGKSVLDIGAWDGFWSFEAARLGADRVVASDSFSWDGRGWGDKASFELARLTLGLEDRVADELVDSMDITPERMGETFDVVLHLGVLYHLRDPITSLERAASVCDELLVLETETAVNFLPYPAARFHPGRTLNDDGTNFYQYNVKALTGMLEEFGFTRFEVVYQHPIWRRLAGSLRAKREGRSFRTTFRSARVILHARR
ncbi:MAG: methyltransferase domain-containing protein [Actinomycetota bacterium]